MNQERIPQPAIFRRFFANYYERTSQGTAEKLYIEPLRKEIVGQAKGLVLEVGAGNGLNFACYNPAYVERVEAIEPDNTMLGYAHIRTKNAPVPIILTKASVEQLPFADKSFDCVVCTLVFCSVNDPLHGLQEIRRVLKPGGRLLMVEHVRSQRRIIALIQDIATPFTRLFMGNCHWNRSTEQVIRKAGFQDIELERRTPAGDLLPIVKVLGRTPQVEYLKLNSVF